MIRTRYNSDRHNRFDVRAQIFFFFLFFIHSFRALLLIISLSFFSSTQFSLTFWRSANEKKTSIHSPLGPFHSNAAGFGSSETLNDPWRNVPKQNSSREVLQHFDPWWEWSEDDDWIPSSPRRHLQLALSRGRKFVCAYRYLTLDDSLLPRKNTVERENSLKCNFWMRRSRDLFTPTSTILVNLKLYVR